MELRGKTVLDLGCGSGSTAIALGQKGAARVLGVDIRPVELARGMLETEYAELAGAVEFRQIAADGSGLGDERFDVVVSKDAFEHVGDPALHVRVIEDHVVDGGDVVIAFGPLWKSPWGSHLGFMTSVPWVHLVFPEEIMLAERRRFRPWEGEISRLDDVPGGLNRMTLARFESVMATSGLECRRFEVDSVGSGPRGQAREGGDARQPASAPARVLRGIRVQSLASARPACLSASTQRSTTCSGECARVTYS